MKRDSTPQAEIAEAYQRTMEQNADIAEGIRNYVHPLTYKVVEVRNVSHIAKKRLAVTVVIRNSDGATAEQIDATLRHAAERARMPGRFRKQKPDAVMAFGYRPTDDIHGQYTLGRFTLGEWSS